MTDTKYLEIIKAPVITEKSQLAKEAGQYTFKVDPRANKTEIKSAIEKLFNVKVASIKTLNEKNVRYDIARMKGLGEMDAEELNETTMDINHRILRKITVDDAISADAAFSKLMGEEVEPRRKFIEENAPYAKNLDF